MWIKRKDWEALKAQIAEQNKILDTVKDATVLIDIERADRLNIFTFARVGKVHKIETMGLIGDDFGQWRKDLLQ